MRPRTVRHACARFRQAPPPRAIERGRRRPVSAKTPPVGAIRYARARLARLRPRLDNGTLEPDNNTDERAIRGIALGRMNRLFAGSETGDATAATAYTLIETAKPNGVDPRARIADTLNHIQDYKTNRIHELMPWNREHKPPP